MPLLGWRDRVALAVPILLAASWLLDAACALGAPTFTNGGDGSFRNITATGGTLRGVDVTAATVQANGLSVAMSALAQQAANAVPASLAGQPNGWLKLDANGLLPVSAMPASGIAAGTCTKALFDPAGRATSCIALSGKDLPTDGTSIGVNANGQLTALGGAGVDPMARALAANAQSLAAAAIPAGQVGVTVAGLDSARSLSQTLSAAASDANQRTFSQHWNDVINAADYGVDCDAGIVVAFSGGPSSTTITSTHYVFGPDDVGRPLLGGYQEGGWTATVTGWSPVTGGVSSATVSTAPPATIGNDAGYAVYVTDNSAAMQRVYQHYLNAPKGAMVSWPIGKCDFSQKQTWNVATPLRFTGMGIGATDFIMTSAGTDAFDFIVSNHADITVDNMTISKSDPNLSFSQDQYAGRFQNTALALHSALSDNGGVIQGSGGIATVAHVFIEGQSRVDTSHGWNVGLELDSFARPIIEYVNVKNGGVADGWPGAAGGASVYANAPNPQSAATESIAIPPSIAPGRGDDFWVHGSEYVNATVTTSEPAGTPILPLNAGSTLGASNTVEDTRQNVSIGKVYSATSSSAVFNATLVTQGTGTSAVTYPAGTVSLPIVAAGSAASANLQSGTIIDLNTNRSLGTGVVANGTVTFGSGGIASAVSSNDVLSSGITVGVTANDTLANGSSYSIDLAFEHDGSDGGNVGLDIEDFQGAYVTDYDAVYGGYEIRSENNDINSLPELIEIENSLLNGYLMDVDLADVGGVGVANSNLIHTFTAPFFQAVWNHGGGQWNISGNQFDAPGQAAASAIAFTTDGPDAYAGFPNNITGNNMLGFSGTCLLNDSRYSSIIATGNDAEQCGTYVNDQTGSNDYSNDVWQYPTQYWTPSTGTEFPGKLLIGTYANTGALTVQNFPTNFQINNKFVLDSGAGTLTESINATHSDSWGGFSVYGGAGSLVLASGTGGSFPALTSGNAEIYGRLLCANAGAYMASWSVLGHYSMQGSPAVGAPAGSVFTPDTDADTAYAIGGSSPRFSLTPQLLPGAAPGVQVVVGPGTPSADCTADLHEMIAQ